MIMIMITMMIIFTPRLPYPKLRVWFHNTLP